MKIYNLKEKQEFLEEVITLEYEEWENNKILSNYYKKFGFEYLENINEKEKLYIYKFF